MMGVQNDMTEIWLWCQNTIWYFEHRKNFQGFKIPYDTSSKCHMTPVQNTIWHQIKIPY